MTVPKCEKPKTYKVGEFTFTDTDCNNKVGPKDQVAIEGTTVDVSTFEKVTGRNIEGKNYKALANNAKKFLPSGKEAASLFKSPATLEEVLARTTVKKFEGSIRMGVEDKGIRISEGYQIEAKDWGSLKYFQQEGYWFIKYADRTGSYIVAYKLEHIKKKMDSAAIYDIGEIKTRTRLAQELKEKCEEIDIALGFKRDRYNLYYLR